MVVYGAKGGEITCDAPSTLRADERLDLTRGVSSRVLARPVDAADPLAIGSKHA